MASRRRQADDGTTAAAKPKRTRSVSIEARTMSFMAKRKALQWKITQLEAAAGADVLEYAELMEDARRMLAERKASELRERAGGSE